MTRKKQADRLQSSLLAAGLAVTGSLFFFDRLGALREACNLSFSTILHSAPALLVIVGVVLALSGRDATANSNQKGPTEN